MKVSAHLYSAITVYTIKETFFLTIRESSRSCKNTQHSFDHLDASINDFHHKHMRLYAGTNV